MAETIAQRIRRENPDIVDLVSACVKESKSGDEALDGTIHFSFADSSSVVFTITTFEGDA